LIIGAAAILAIADVSAAQVSAPTASPVKYPTVRYENSLRSAVMLAAQQLAQRAAAVVPEITLETADQPIVRGVKLDDYGYIFDVQAPNIQKFALVSRMVQQARPNRGPYPSAGAIPTQPVNNGRVESNVAVAADPMSAAVFDADKEYTGFVKDALMDAMIDQSASLPLTAADHLTILATGVEEMNGNPLYRSMESKLILKISGADLLDFRQGKITRDQARAKIVEDRF
jgi:hypothetical protein